MFFSDLYDSDMNLSKNHMQHLSEGFNYYNYYPSKLDNFFLVLNFNAEMPNSYIQDLGAVFNLKNLIKKPTCFKNRERSTDIDHILTNHNRFW